MIEGRHTSIGFFQTFAIACVFTCAIKVQHKVDGDCKYNKEEYNFIVGDWLILGRGRSKYLTYPFRIDKHIILQRNMNSNLFELGFPESCQCKIVDCVVFARLTTISRSVI